MFLVIGYYWHNEVLGKENDHDSDFFLYSWMIFDNTHDILNNLYYVLSQTVMFDAYVILYMIVFPYHDCSVTHILILNCKAKLSEVAKDDIYGLVLSIACKLLYLCALVCIRWVITHFLWSEDS